MKPKVSGQRNANSRCRSGDQRQHPMRVRFSDSRSTCSAYMVPRHRVSGPPPPSSLVAGVVLVRVIILVTVGVLLELSRNIKQPSPPPAR